MNDFNASVIAEFRAHGGRVGGPFEGAPLLLLTSTGAKSGEERTTPVMYLPDGERMVIFASKAGAPTNPAWYHNLVANPTATVELGTESFQATARVASGEERAELYNRQAELRPQFADYAEKTTREIPVVVLERQA
ncbi:MAG TPA: nitroreductase family deazaflavin-dependent oxidoreductase [Solirubrobacteraceae bacterium]